MKENSFEISVVIPCYENLDSLKICISSIFSQIFKPKEIIVVDSSYTENINKYISKIISNKSSIEIIYFNQKNLYPGKARNIGISKSKYDWIAFLDSKTFAKKNWLNKYKELIISNNYDVIFGSTKFIAKNNQKISKLFLYSTFGNKSHTTVPGTVIKRKYCIQNEFLENFRSGEDVLWKENIENNFLIESLIIKNDYLTIYDQIENNVVKNIYKHFIYSIYTSVISIKNNIKDIYLSFFLILTALLVPKWNVLIGGWDSNPLYVPNITKFYILTLSIILILYLFFRNFFSIFKYFKKTFLFKLIFLILFIFISIFIFNWNEEYSIRYYNTIFKLPHITKIYLTCIVIISIIYRGIYVPLKNEVEFKELIYLEWIKIGFIGLLIDIVKSPAFIFGSIISITKIDILFNIYKFKNKRKKLLIICPFPYDVQAGQRLKYEQHLKFFYLNGYDIKLSPFINKSTWNIIYKKGFYLNKLIALFFGYIKRILLIPFLNKYDVVYIFMWVVPYTSNFVEYIYRNFSKKIIYDMEDNILIISKNEINPITSSFKSVNKYKFLIKNSDQNIVSSIYLEKLCNNISNKNNSNYICASINLHRYIPSKINEKKIINIGWTGTFSTKKYLKIIEPVIQELAKQINIRFIVIGDFKYNLDNVNVKNIFWKKSSEIKDLQQIDIGVYPLTKDEWVLGKSGLKALQYMALGIPTIATDYGNIRNIIINNSNGFLVSDYKEWLNALRRLCDDIDLRKLIGNKGRRHVEKFYSLEVISEKYLDVIKKL